MKYVLHFLVRQMYLWNAYDSSDHLRRASDFPTPSLSGEEMERCNEHRWNVISRSKPVALATRLLIICAFYGLQIIPSDRELNLLFTQIEFDIFQNWIYEELWCSKDYFIPG